MRASHGCCLLVIALGLAGCTGLPKSTDAPGKPSSLVAHAWTLPSCPSEATRSPSLAALGGVAIGIATDMAIGAIGSALDAAAAADKDGVSASGTDARYLYLGIADRGNVVAAPAGCFVVAVTGPVALTSDEPLEQGGALRAEIRLDVARDGTGVHPKLVKLEYPRALDGREHALRSLAISVEARLPAQARGLDAFIWLPDVAPRAAAYSADELGTQRALWTVMPAYAGPKPGADDAGESLGAVNLATEVRETGDPNVFLQAFASAFRRAKSDLTQVLQ